MDCSHPTAELLPESQGHFGSHIHAPTVDAILGVAVPVGVHPPAHDRMEVRAHFGVQILRIAVDFREVLDATPAAVVELIGRGHRIIPAGDVEPVGEAAAGPFPSGLLQGPEGGSGMVEDSVDDDPHFPSVDFADEFQEQPVGRTPAPGGGIGGIFGSEQSGIACGVRAEMTVDVVVPRRAVLVQRRGVEDRVEVQCVDAQILQVIEPVENALQIAAVPPQLGVVVEVLPAGLFPRLQRVPVASPR